MGFALREFQGAAGVRTVADVSGKIGLSSRRFIQVFTDEVGLTPKLFCRVHRSGIVNLDRVRSLKVSEDGEYEVLLENGARVRISRRYRKQLQERMGLRSEMPSG